MTESFKITSLIIISGSFVGILTATTHQIYSRRHAFLGVFWHPSTFPTAIFLLNTNF